MAFGETFKALSDPVRREILELLKEKKLSAGEIAEKFELTGATVSYHLSTLKKADLIREEKVKNFIYYELNASVFEELMMWIAQFNSVQTEEKPKRANSTRKTKKGELK
ncbi:MAG: winged helix-turn-helix transcriptional regulator [Treponema sp.]|nr:winged helix-turn-helix transcriptional regulator [Candidatus Treponema scatequi]